MNVVQTFVEWGLHGNFWTFCGMFIVLYLVCKTTIGIMKYLFLLIGMIFLQRNSKIAETIAKMYCGEIMATFANHTMINSEDKENGTKEENSETNS